MDLDTGDLVYPGTYSLEDYTYADLLHEMTRDPSTPIPFGIKRDLLAYFADPEKAKYLERKPKLPAEVKADLPVLETISTKAAYPDTAFLPEPTTDMAPNQSSDATPAQTGTPATPEGASGAGPASKQAQASVPQATGPKL